MEMKIRKVKRRCDVRRCSNTECYSISYSSEPGNSIIICTECLAKANAMINPTKEVKKAEKPAVKDEPKKAPEKKAEKDDAE